MFHVLFGFGNPVGTAGTLLERFVIEILKAGYRFAAEIARLPFDCTAGTE